MPEKFVLISLTKSVISIAQWFLFLHIKCKYSTRHLIFLHTYHTMIGLSRYSTYQMDFISRHFPQIGTMTLWLHATHADQGVLKESLCFYEEEGGENNLNLIMECLSSRHRECVDKISSDKICFLST